ncbi:hypothetical protein [Pseudophaeobacter leonis]|uniref:hypothetical protein n=1 Tax=Pseudophaeobacter leonis TaxID=1144477 RepID=UPI0009F324F6|nr:hypothetical protein [Pseudophaeobacter leonis]
MTVHSRGVKPPISADSEALTKAPVVPKYLASHAKAEWRRIMPQLIGRISGYLTSHSYTAAGIITAEQYWLTTYDSIRGHAVDPERQLLFLSVDKPHPENRGIAVIDYSDPTAMVEIAYISFYETIGNEANTAAQYMHWDADWQRLLVTASATAVYVDISNGAAPAVLGHFHDTTYLAGATTIRPAGDIS